MYKLSQKPFISTSRKEERLDKLAQELKEGNFDILLSVLTGSYMFTADISRRIASPDLQINFIKASSYGNSTESSGKITISGLESINIEGKNVLLIDDILDSGNTMKFLVEELKARKCKSVKTCVLLNKESRRSVDIHADYVGFEIEDKFVVGYGLDFAEKYRTLPEIWTLSEE